MALLSACGLYAPVQSALVPYTDAFMLRNFSADSPLEGKSSFAVEMVEMRSAHHSNLMDNGGQTHIDTCEIASCYA